VVAVSDEPEKPKHYALDAEPGEYELEGADTRMTVTRPLQLARMRVILGV
jgi:hypothetical protein